MPGFSTHLAHALMNHVFRGTSYTPPSDTYLALFVADPTDDDLTANELSAAWYGRHLIGAWTPPAAGVSSNTLQLTFNAVTDNAVTISHWGIYDQQTGGNLLASDKFTNPKTLNINDVFVVAPNDLMLTWD